MKNGFSKSRRKIITIITPNTGIRISKKDSEKNMSSNLFTEKSNRIVILNKTIY